MSEFRFRVGDPVRRRRDSDYRFPGWVVARFRKRDDRTGDMTGPARYVVQDDRDTLFIQSAESIEPRLEGEC